MAGHSRPWRKFATCERVADGIAFDSVVLPWSRIVRVGWVIDLGWCGTDDTDWLVLEDDAGVFAWIGAVGYDDGGLACWLRGGLADLPETVWSLPRHSSGPSAVNLNTVVWPPELRGRAMFGEQRSGFWLFERVRLRPLPRNVG
jgi:hypothetical protein